MKETINKLKILYQSWAKENVLDISPLAQSGSYRKYFRISGKEKTAICVFNSDKKEKRAFVTFTKHFFKKGLNVPRLFAQNLKENIYLIEDLGDTALFSLVEKDPEPGGLNGGVQIRAICEYDIGTLAAAFQPHPFHVGLAGVLQDLLADHTLPPDLALLIGNFKITIRSLLAMCR